MDIDAVFPLKLWINLGRREDRRLQTEFNLADAGITARRFPAIDARSKRKPFASTPAELPQAAEKTGDPGSIDAKAAEVDIRGYESAGRYALALTQRLALREAARRGAPAVLLLEDDVQFHPNFQELIKAVEVPDDWGIFYLGCAHSQPPRWAGNRVVRVTHAVDTHAVAIRAPYYKQVMRMLDRHGKPDLGVAKASDQFLALLHRKIPTYACYPNLAWQAVSESDLTGTRYSNYGTDGQQRNWTQTVAGLLGEVINPPEEPKADSETERFAHQANGAEASRGASILRSHQPSSGTAGRPRLGLLFLTRGDVNHPQIWREFLEEAPERARVFSHPKFPEQLQGGFLDGTAISEWFDTKWGDISLVRASRSLLLEALEDKTLTHFALLSESCVPIRPLPEILRRLELDPRSQFGYNRPHESHAKHRERSGAAPLVPTACWRFTSQWWLMDRITAVLSAGVDYTGIFENMFVPDESYFATVLAMQGFPLEDGVLRRYSTWTSWEKNAGSPTSWPEIPVGKLRDLFQSGALFARKFPKEADIGRYGLHRSPAFAASKALDSGRKLSPPRRLPPLPERPKAE
ncbi:beta-1,6-N-acetylglucosaminyltransferase [Luteolibacter luteus]|uniref:Glycosyltransferase family 25 protein n=1 Tax=Luteolibacter luteus TaxID=2728835 RepID=A0A858RK06_9BACT|nr:beta-1,6-N-acetylglucosaminyltransferase [Luteolibacter luteus]QJE96798.1 hypothetical protein HHL09_13735 [Luteolibacter luteus]